MYGNSGILQARVLRERNDAGQGGWAGPDWVETRSVNLKA